ncbi:threonine-phosphate decarboxylase CobD [Virgibacillus byunsanensis]|uniref:threonine-phosphate decarboxylase n=1 Tax=Virgibacillus byunsanensis TaxID=570945 RepID=A0ABW3LK60_9BACI
MKWPNHGGQPEAIKQLLCMNDEKQLLDFSANLNPLGPPTWLEEALTNSYETIRRYPDPAYSTSSAMVADHEEIEPDKVSLTNGGAEAIFLVAKYFEQGKALIVHPTFLEYERACKHYHIDVEDIFYEQANDFKLPVETILAKLKNKNVLFLCRPNNPSGTVIPEEDIKVLLEEGKKTGTYVVVDEAFVDFLPASIPGLTSWLAAYPNLILLRSLTKMYTIPGLRIGYIMADTAIINVLKEEQIPWSINALVNAIVPKLLEDSRFVEQTRDWLQEQSNYIYRTLKQLNFYFSDSNVNFYLLRDNIQPKRTEALFYFLVENGILTRHTHNFKGLRGEFLRTAIRSKEENEQLLAALQKWREMS